MGAPDVESLDYPRTPETLRPEEPKEFPKQLIINDYPRPSEMPSEYIELLNSVNRISGQTLNLPIENVQTVDDEIYGPIIEIHVIGNARAILNRWPKLIDTFKQFGINMPIFLKWVGKLDVNPEELGNYFGLALAKMGLKLRTKEPIDTTKIVSELRGL